MFDQIIDTGLIEAVNTCIREYAQAVSQARGADKLDKEGDHQMDGEFVISTGGPKTLESTYSETTISLLVGVLSLGCRFSQVMVSTILAGGIF